MGTELSGRERKPGSQGNNLAIDHKTIMLRGITPADEKRAGVGWMRFAYPPYGLRPYPYNFGSLDCVVS